MKETGKCSDCGKHAVIWRRTAIPPPTRNTFYQYCKKCALGRDNSEV